MTTLALDGFKTLFFVLLLAAVAIGAWLAHRATMRRREALADLARRLNLFFDHRKDRSHDHVYAHFEVFRRGSARAAYNTLSGILPVGGMQCQLKAGDFTYTVSSGKSSTTYNFSYLILHLPFPAVPDLLIRREGVFDKLAGVFGFPDINFESAEFSRRFHVRSPDRRFAYAVVTPRMMEFLLVTNPGVVDIERGRMCLTDGTRTWTPEEFEARIRWARDFLALWPDHLTASLDGGAQAARS